MTDLDEFHLFSNLPPELRRPIWYFALPGPRSIGYPPWEEAHEPPAILRVNRESRQVALEHYEISEGSGRRKTYIDFKTDIVSESCLRYSANRLIPRSNRAKALRAEIEKVHNLVLSYPSMNWLGEELCRWFEENIHRFPHLQHVIVRFRDPGEDGSFTASIDQVDQELIYLAREIVDWNMKELKSRETGELLKALPLVTFEKVAWTKSRICYVPLSFGSSIPPVRRP